MIPVVFDKPENILTADTRRQYADKKTFFARATLLTSLETGLPGQKPHAFQAEDQIGARSDCYFCLRRSRRQKFCVCPRLSSEQSERAVH